MRAIRMIILIPIVYKSGARAGQEAKVNENEGDYTFLLCLCCAKCVLGTV